MIYVIENERPLVRLMVWALRQEGFDVMSAPMPSDAPSFGDRAPSHVVINCGLGLDQCRQLVDSIRTAVSAVSIMDLGNHNITDCGADDHLPEPHKVGVIIEWLQRSAERLEA